jgi:hypothetical protein
MWLEQLLLNATVTQLLAMLEVTSLWSCLTKLLTFQQKMRILGDVPRWFCALGL